MSREIANSKILWYDYNPRFHVKKLALVLKIFATGSLSLLLSACYGVVQVMYGVPMGLRGIVKVKSSENVALPGIKVSYKVLTTGQPDPLNWNQLGLTDSLGSLDYALYDFQGPEYSLKLLVEDVDGVENLGEFSPTTLVVDEWEEIVNLDKNPL